MKVKAKKPSHKSESNKDEEDNVEESKIKEKSQKLKALAASLALKSRKNGHESTNKTKKHQERSINSSFIEDHSDDDDDDEKLTTSEKKDKSSSTNVDDPRTFADLGLVDSLVDATKALGWKKPSAIQKQAIPQALEGKDIIGLAQTGSGKTGAFALPILQDLLENPSPFFACVLSPTRELAVQISEQFEALGASMGVRCAVVVGGIDMISQSIALAKRPHIIIGTPGRLVDHLENTKGFNLRSLKYLVLDEADRLLTLDFGDEIEKILAAIPRKRSTYLFSATMTTRVAKLQRASLTNPVKVEVSTKYSTVDTLIQQYLFLPAKHKDVYLAYALNELTGSTIMVFTSTCNTTLRLTIMLRNLGFSCVPLHGQMTQPKRLGALTKFKSGQRNILIATDVASRGLDIPLVDCVINFDIPAHSKDYIHRVGRTARAGRSGRAITFVSQYDIELYQRIETLIGKKLPAFDAPQEEVMLLLERVLEAQRFAAMEVKERADSKKNNKRKRGGGGYEDGGGGGGGKRRK